MEEARVQRAENKTLHDSRDGLLVANQELQDKQFVSQITLKSLNEKHERTLRRMNELQRRLQENGIDIDPRTMVSKEPPPTTVEGEVKETRKLDSNGTEFVEITIGTDDDIRKGHELFVYRANGEAKYLGKIRITNVWPDKAVGTVVQKNKNGTIKKGDKVTSRL
jgi:hypothetical protein